MTRKRPYTLGHFQNPKRKSMEHEWYGWKGLLMKNRLETTKSNFWHFFSEPRPLENCRGTGTDCTEPATQIRQCKFFCWNLLRNLTILNFFSTSPFYLIFVYLKRSTFQFFFDMLFGTFVQKLRFYFTAWKKSVRLFTHASTPHLRRFFTCTV